MMLWIKRCPAHHNVEASSPQLSVTFCALYPPRVPGQLWPILTQGERKDLNLSSTLLYPYVATRLPFLFRYFRRDFLRMNRGSSGNMKFRELI